MVNNYLESIRKQFEYYKMLGDRTFAQLSEQELLWCVHPDGNSIAIIVNHISGNMKSRWTGFLTSDGEKEWRNRDEEFEAIIQSKRQLLDAWETGWETLFGAIESINETNFETIVYIRNQGHTITEAINRQLSHYSYHVGQVVLIGKIIKGSEWQSLSIPKGGSKSYNSDKFSKEKTRGHFTDEFLDGSFFEANK